MAQGDPYARFVNMIKRQRYDGFEMQRAQVVSVNPISIAVNGQVISRHLYCNEITNSNKDEELAELLAAEEYISPTLKGFLKELYEGLRVKEGDCVLVQRVGNSFYICGKVVGL